MPCKPRPVEKELRWLRVVERAFWIKNVKVLKQEQAWHIKRLKGDCSAGKWLK